MKGTTTGGSVPSPDEFQPFGGLRKNPHINEPVMQEMRELHLRPMQPQIEALANYLMMHGIDQLKFRASNGMIFHLCDDGGQFNDILKQLGVQPLQHGDMPAMMMEDIRVRPRIEVERAEVPVVAPQDLVEAIYEMICAYHAPTILNRLGVMHDKNRVLAEQVAVFFTVARKNDQESLATKLEELAKKLRS